MPPPSFNRNVWYKNDLIGAYRPLIPNVCGMNVPERERDRTFYANVLKAAD